MYVFWVSELTLWVSQRADAEEDKDPEGDKPQKKRAPKKAAEPREKPAAKKRGAKKKNVGLFPLETWIRPDSR